VTRREFITLLGSSAAAWPLAPHAQQPPMRRIGVLTPYAADDREGQAGVAALQQGLAELGWTDGRNARIDTRWGAGDPARYRQYAAELVALAPNVIVAATSPVVAALQRETRIRGRGGHRSGRRRLGCRLRASRGTGIHGQSGRVSPGTRQTVSVWQNTPPIRDLGPT
jgi:hypothetical protein